MLEPCCYEKFSNQRELTPKIRAFPCDEAVNFPLFPLFPLSPLRHLASVRIRKRIIVTIAGLRRRPPIVSRPPDLDPI